MQVAAITLTSPNGTIGMLTLSPVQIQATHVMFVSGKQIVLLETTNFRAAFGYDNGR